MNPKAFRTLALLLAAAPFASLAQSDPTHMSAIAHVDPRFQSFNVEMVEIIGGRFWKPYDSTPIAKAKSDGAIPGIDPNLFEKREPLDLYNLRLRKLAAALSPTYIRVSGTWANNVFFQASDAPQPAEAPKGFGGVLTRKQWKGVIDFTKAVDAKLVTSFSVSEGTRDKDGVWNTTQAKIFVDETHKLGGSIAAAEYINEPSFPTAFAPASYSGADFGRDYKIFAPFMRKTSPETMLLGPGPVGEGPTALPIKLLSTEDMLKGTGPNAFDAFSYHFYGAVSSRCSSGMGGGTKPEDALTSDWLDRTNGVYEYYAAFRNKYDPKAPMWLTETGQTACGGDRWAATFIDTFRYLNQMGALAQKDVKVIMHNTLSAADYAIIDERTLTPRPNYWAALLWHRTMGTTVLNPGTSPSPSVRVYAQCSVNGGGSVTVLALNTSKTDTAHVHLAGASQRYTLTAPELLSHSVSLNGQPLALSASGDVPELHATPQKPGDADLPAASITFFVVSSAHNSACTR